MFRWSGRSYGNATQTITNDPNDWDDLDRLGRVEFYPDDRDDRVNFEAIIWKRSLRRLRRSGRSKAIPEVITFNPVIENKFGPNGAEAEKIIHKCSLRVWGLFEIRESPWHQVFEEIVCLRGTLLASQCRKIKRKSRYGTRFALRIKIIHLCGLFAKGAQKFYCLTQRHRWRPRVFCLWGDRDDHMETTNRPSRPDRLEIFWNDWGDRDDPDDHMETRL